MTDSMTRAGGHVDGRGVACAGAGLDDSMSENRQCVNGAAWRGAAA